MMPGRLRLHWLFNRRVGHALLWTVLLLVAAIIVNLLGIRMLGSIDAWEQWMDDHADHFLAWRLLLYAGTVWGWMWMRRRLLAREPERDTRQRLMRTEIAAVFAVAALETSMLLVH